MDRLKSLRRLHVHVHDLHMLSIVLQREKELNLSHKSELDNLNNELTAARKACSDAVEVFD